MSHLLLSAVIQLVVLGQFVVHQLSKSFSVLHVALSNIDRNCLIICSKLMSLTFYHQSFS